MDAMRMQLFGFLAVVIGVTATVDRVSAQFRRGIQNTNQSELITPPREVSSLIDEVETHIENKQWSEATLAISTLLGLEEKDSSSDVGTDYFLPPIDRSLGQRSSAGNLFSKVLSIAEELPEEAFEVLQVRHGVDAEQMLGDAIQRGDWNQIERVATRFGLLEAGQDAALLVADRALQQGDAGKAALLYSRLLNQRRALARLGPEIGLFAVSAWLSAGNKDMASQSLNALTSSVPSYQMKWNNKSIQWSQNERNLDTILEVLRPVSAKPFERTVSQPYVAGGDARRNATTPAGIPLVIRRWHTELHESNQHYQNIDGTLKLQLSKQPEQAASLIPSRVPISVGRSVIVSTYDQRIIAIDALTGLLQWVCPYSGMPLGFSLERVVPGAVGGVDDGVPEYLEKRIWGEAATGNIATDGQRVFNVSELPSIDVAEAYALGPNARFGRPTGMKSSNVLQCWSVASEGKLLWEVGGAKSAIEPALANALFLGPPLPYRGELLVLAEVNGTVALHGLTPESGKRIWEQPLVANTAGVIATDVLRRSVGACPSVDGSVVVCPTLSGHVVGFDLLTRMLKWAVAYKTRENTSASQVSAFGAVDLGNYSAFDARAVDLAPVIGNGVAVFAPQDGEGVYGIDTQSGMVRWHQLANRANNVRYVGGVFEDCVAIVCQNSVVGLDLYTGQAKWPTLQFKGNTQVVGRGVRRGEYLYLPLSDQSIAELDFKTGKVRESIRLEHIPGNLSCVNDRLISASPFALECYVIRDVFRNEVKAELELASVSASSLMKRGELALAEGNIDEAMDLLERAYNADPNDQECWERLRRASSVALNSDFEKYAARVAGFKIDLEDDFVFLRTLVHGLQKQGNYKSALMKLIELSDVRTARRRDQLGANDYFEASPALTIQEDRWIESQIQATLKNLVGASGDSQLQELVVTQLKKLDAMQPNLQRLKLKHLRAFPQVAPARVRLANELLEEGKLLDAEEVLLEGTMDSERDLRNSLDPQSRLILAKIYGASYRLGLAMKLLNEDPQASNEFTEWYSKWRNQEHDRQLFSIQDGIEPAPMNLAAWPTSPIEVKITELQQMPMQGFIQEQASSYRIRKTVGEAMRGWSVGWIDSSNLVLISNQNGAGQGGIRLGSAPINSKLQQVYAIDGKLILEWNRHLIALDALQRVANEDRGELWHRYFDPAPSIQETGRGRPLTDDFYFGFPVQNKGFRIVDVGRFGIIVMDDDLLLCLDAKTGDTQWKHAGFKDSTVLVKQDRIFASLPSNRLVTLDAKTGVSIDAHDFRVDAEYSLPLADVILFAKKQSVSLFDPESREILMSRDFSADTVFGVVDGQAWMAMDNRGKYFYWNVKSRKGFEHSVELLDDQLPVNPDADQLAKKLTLVSRNNCLLVLPFNPTTLVEDVVLQNDPAYAPVSGSVFAISTEDGSPRWEKAALVQHYDYPLVQAAADNPLVFFVRKIFLRKAFEGKAANTVSVGVLDIRNGQILFENMDSIAPPRSNFVQSASLLNKRVQSIFHSVLFDVSWNDAATPVDPKSQLGVYERDEYKDRIIKILQQRKDARENAQKLPVLPNP